MAKSTKKTGEDPKKKPKGSNKNILGKKAGYGKARKPTTNSSGGGKFPKPKSKFSSSSASPDRYKKKITDDAFNKKSSAGSDKGPYSNKKADSRPFNKDK